MARKKTHGMTASGKPITEELVEKLADKAEAGYDCEHCGGVHGEVCPVREATARILEGYQPRGMTIGRACPNCGVDGVWHWHPPGGSAGFRCEACQRVVPRN